MPKHFLNIEFKTTKILLFVFRFRQFQVIWSCHDYNGDLLPQFILQMTPKYH